MKILVNAFGTGGDVLPFLTIAQELAALGHAPTLALNPACEAQARATGLPFVAVGPRWDIDELSRLDRYLDPNRGGIRIWEEVCLPNVVPTYRELSALMARERPDAVLAHFLSVGAQWAARAAGVRCAIATLAPCWWCSRDIPSIFSPMVPPRWLHRHLTGLARFLFDRMISEPLAPVCAELGRPFRKDEYFRIFQEAELDLALWSPAFRPAAGDDPPGTRICGFPFPSVAPAAALDPRVSEFLDAGPPPVVVGLGTSVRNFGGPILINAARACAELGRRALLIGQEIEGLPETALSVRAAPFGAVFPRAEVILHHGGIGTMAEALRAGRAALVAPFTSDQFDNALLAERAGVARTIARSKLTGRGLAKRLREVLESAPMKERAAKLGETLRAEPAGAAVAAQAIVRWAA